MTSRSKTVILVKNLPSKTDAKEIKELFEVHGELGRVILPPSGITGKCHFLVSTVRLSRKIFAAIVEFLEPSEARKAFVKLAYSKFKNVPLYLEWAPENSLNAQKSSQRHEDLDKNQEEPKNIEEEEEEEEPEPDTTLFVKNLNFQTTDQSLKQVSKKH